MQLFPQIVRQKLYKEIAERQVEGPFQLPPFHNFHISPLGVVPKRKSNEFCIIHHLLFPKGDSLNDELDDALCSVSYSTFEGVVVKIRSYGPGALLAKADIKSAFRLLPISLLAFNALGFYFDECYFFDKSLPMGCSVSCAYFETFSTFLHWVLCGESGMDSVVHYLDDFLFIGPHGSAACGQLLQTFRGISSTFGVPLVEEKTLLPTTS